MVTKFINESSLKKTDSLNNENIRKPYKKAIKYVNMVQKQSILFQIFYKLEQKLSLMALKIISKVHRYWKNKVSYLLKHSETILKHIKKKFFKI